MLLPIILVGLALFVLAFLGLNKLGATLFGLVAVLGLLFGLYFVWCGFTGSNENSFGWGVLLLLVSGGVLVFLKSAFSD